MVIQRQPEQMRPQPPRWATATVSAVLLVAVFAILALLSRDDEGRAATTTAAAVAVATTEAATTTAPPLQPVVTEIPLGQPVPLRVLTMHRGNAAEVSVIDLETRTTTLYPTGTHGVPSGLYGTSVSLMPDRAWMVTMGGAARLYSGSLAEADAVVRPDPLRPIGPRSGDTMAVPAADGDHIWLVRPAMLYGDNDDPALVDLIAVTGEPVLTMELDMEVWPVAAVTSGLVFNSHQWLDTGDGFTDLPGSEAVLLLSRDGTVAPIGPGRAIAASGTAVARLVPCPPGDDCTGDGLFVSDLTGADAVEVPPPAMNRWFAPNSLSSSALISPDGTELLMGGTYGFDVNGTPAAPMLYVVDLETHTVRPILSFTGAMPYVAWSADGEWIAILDSAEIELIDAENPGRRIVLPDLIPTDHEPVAAG